ncbi:MFS general substrate transporter [Yamadazyma tenuis ATCC 10573]|nr:MFS general substrate transporter [Yamadazyma tenuis ATCC 10573]EGV61180.1 MFS general substrate transporter [Yamadazyma tenuis ATCC 10573]
MVLISDIVTLKQRGNYQGILGANVGLGNACGPFLMSAFVSSSSWRNFYHMLPGLVAIQMATTYFFVEDRKKHLDSVLTKKEKFMKVDYIGMFFSTAGLTLILVPLNGGGSTYSWNSVLVIVMFVVGGLCSVAFIVVEWKIPKLPMIPLNLFQSTSLNLIFSSNFFYGLIYFSFQYYLPYYFQIVLGKTEMQSAVLQVGMVLIQALMSTIAGQIISRSGHYKYVICGGYGSWLLGLGLLMLFDINTPDGEIVGILLVIGCGVGWTFQPSVVAAQAQSRKADRAVVISTRNVVRCLGGAIGTAVASLIVTNTVMAEINKAFSNPDNYDNISVGYLTYLKEHIYNKISVQGLTDGQVTVVKKMYMKAIRNYFYMTIPLMGFCFISAFFVKDRGLRCIDEVIEKEEKESEV